MTRSDKAGTSGDWTLVEDDRAFAALVDRLAEAPAYAVDTEFHRERTYYPQVALVQLADRHGVSLVDALTVDLAPLRRVLEGPGLAVMHASRQDMEVLQRACGTVPTRLVDTQIEAGFLGYTSASLSALLEREMHVRTGKADRLTDWLARPLTERQLAYAADDVAHLLDLHERLWARLEERGRTEWVQEACDELRSAELDRRSPEEAWRRIKEVRHLKGSRLAVAQAVAAWRDDRAEQTDTTPRFVLSDLGVVSIASSAPTSVEELRRLRGVEGRALRSGVAEELLGVVKGARNGSPARREPSQVPELDGDLRPVVPLISAWVSQRSRELELETALLATRSDLEDLLRGDPDARLTHGWREEIVGEPIRSLVAGRKALVFRRGTGLELVDI